MQGYFESNFKGKKKYIDKLIEYILEKSKEDNMYDCIKELMHIPTNYNMLDSNDEAELEIYMPGHTSGNINFLDEYTYFSQICKVAPELEMKGYYLLLDAYDTEYYSPKDSDGYMENDEDKRYEDYESYEVCSSCGEMFDIDKEDDIKLYDIDDIFANHIEVVYDDYEIYEKYGIEYEDLELCERTIPIKNAMDESIMCINCYAENNEMYYPVCKVCNRMDLISKRDNKYFNLSSEEVDYEVDAEYICNSCK